MDDVLSHTRTNFQHIRNVVEEQFRRQAQNTSILPKQEVVHHKEPISEKSPKRDLIENKPDSGLSFKITGDTFYKVIDLLNNRNVHGKDAPGSQPIYDYLPSDVLCVNVHVNTLDSHSSITSSSFESDHYMTPRQCTSCQYVSTNKTKTSDPANLTTIKDYSVNESKDLHTLRVGSRIYYDSYKNPRIERRYTSVVAEAAQADSSKYQGAITEIVQTEYTYVAGLHYVYHNYILYFRSKRGKRLPKLEPFFLIFEQIFWKQSEFYKGFFPCKSLGDIASHFIDNVKLFQMYKNYILNLNTALNHLTIEYRFEILKRQQELASSMCFEDYLLCPMQRLSKYVLLLEESESHFQQKWQMSSNITAILSVLKKLLISSKADARIVDSITNKPTSLIDYGSFIMKESFCVRKIRVTGKLMIFLFQEVIIFTAPEEGDVYSYKYHIPMKDLSMRIIVDNPISFEVMDFHGSKDKEKDMYVLETVDPRTKETWVEVIESLLWEQLIFCKNKLDGDNVFKERSV